MAIPPGEESAVGDFAAHLLALLGYDIANRFIHQRKDTPLFMCGGQTHAKTDVCVVDRNHGGILLLVQDKRHMEEVSVPNRSSLRKRSPLFNIITYA